MDNKTIIYSDLDLSFKPHPLTGDLVPKTNVEAIRRSILLAIHFDKFDVPFDKTKQSSLKKLLFEPVSQTTEVSIRKDIEWVFKNMEQRVNLLRTEIKEMENESGYDITVVYNIRSLMMEDNFNFFVERIR